ncbi:MAG: type II toxin-antitoxin system PemK/MazF family toxin [Bacteroidetes bacterium]|nr:type II toxin-antitoxin system PemK/MazF family toxin [Bacteroidota bacterium]
MEEGFIILTIFPQDKEKKLRPALVLRQFPKYGDVLVCGITSQLHQFIPDFDILLDTAHTDYKLSGLKAPGICRLNMLTMISTQQINGKLGYVAPKTLNTLLKNLADYLLKK